MVLEEVHLVLMELQVGHERVPGVLEKVPGMLEEVQMILTDIPGFCFLRYHTDP